MRPSLNLGERQVALAIFGVIGGLWLSAGGIAILVAAEGEGSPVVVAIFFIGVGLFALALGGLAVIDAPPPRPTQPLSPSTRQILHNLETAAIMNGARAGSTPGQLRLELGGIGLEGSVVKTGIELSAILPRVQALAPALRIAARDEAWGGRATRIGDPIMDRLLHIDGVEPDIARALLADQHAALLPIFCEAPRARIAGGRLWLKADPTLVREQGTALLRALVAAASALEARAAELAAG